jgi:DNA-binding response OmpR family regulator
VVCRQGLREDADVPLLLIEDYALLQKTLARGLREEGFAVDVASDGEEGLWYARTGEYDVIVLDLMLPKLDGLAVLRKLREEGRATHVIILTARDRVEDRVRGLDLGADDYLVKPFALEELLARIRALVRRKYEAKAPALTVGDLEIDTVQRTARRGGEPLRLTAREYGLLEYLALKAGRVVSRTDIREHLYGFGDEADSNVVDACVSRVRRKLEQGGRPRLIQTRRGFGYILEEQP